jgi:hypothetical protein
MKMNAGIKGVAIATIIAISGVLIFSRTDKEEDKQYNSEFKNEYAVYAIPLPEQMDFAGESVPLNDPDIHERIDRELHVNTYWQSNGLLTFKRAHKYFPIIEPILAENGVPDDFKYLAVIESGLRNVVSPAGAAGYWQFMKTSGREFGLEINSEVDERYHLEKATVAACKYLLQAKEKFGSWTLAAASYNMGMGGLNKQLTRQKEDDYYDLLLNSETSRYVMRILALKEIMEHPKEYGFNFREKDLYPIDKVKVITVDTAVANFADFAQERGLSYKTLKYHNPWLRQTYLKNTTGKSYQIKLPE